MKTTLKSPNRDSAAASATQVSSKCFVCQRPVGEGGWFCRVAQKRDEAADPRAEKILLCSPACAFRYFATTETGTRVNHSTERNKI